MLPHRLGRAVSGPSAGTGLPGALSRLQAGRDITAFLHEETRSPTALMFRELLPTPARLPEGGANSLDRDARNLRAALSARFHAEAAREAADRALGGPQGTYDVLAARAGILETRQQELFGEHDLLGRFRHLGSTMLNAGVTFLPASDLAHRAAEALVEALGAVAHSAGEDEGDAPAELGEVLVHVGKTATEHARHMFEELLTQLPEPQHHTLSQHVAALDGVAPVTRPEVHAREHSAAQDARVTLAAAHVQRIEHRGPAYERLVGQAWAADPARQP